jgi:hypothetical protein
MSIQVRSDRLARSRGGLKVIPMANTTGTLKAHGRSLADFKPLLLAEEKLLKACGMGELATIDTGKRPEKMTDDNQVRPGFIRFLALGGDDDAPVHEIGVKFRGAWIDGRLDLEACHWIAPLFIVKCRINGDVSVRDATLSTFSLEATAINSLRGDGLKTSGTMYLRNGFSASGEARLLGARIGGDLECNGGKFEPTEGSALICDGADINGSVLFTDGFHAAGLVSLLSTKIGGQLICNGGKFEPTEGDALNCDEAHITGNVLFTDGFHATGVVRLCGARIGGDLYCEGGKFEPTEGDALSCDGAKIGGALFFRNVGKITGRVSFAGAEVNSLADDRESWALAPHLMLDGFHYGRIIGKFTDAATRIAWLIMQSHEHLKEEFRPQPWEQLIKVLRDMGHDADAREVAIEKQRMLYAAGKIAGVVPRFLHRAYGSLSSYGYRPMQTVHWMIGIWLVCGYIYWNSDQRGILAPTSPIIHANAEINAKCGNKSGIRFTTWTECKDLPQEYTTFNPWLYSLDLVLPLVDLQQDRDWAPIVTEDDGVTWIGLGVFTRFVMWLEILFGWCASLLLVAVLGNLVKKD